jgi:5-formyltetrahydrofolate cyclo-ligase
MSSKQKGHLRAIMLSERKKMDFKEVHEKSEKIMNKFLNYYEKYKSFILYFSFDNEVQTLPLANHLIGKGKSVYSTKLNGNELMPGAVKDLGSLQRNIYGICEPLNYENVFEFDVAVVPGVAFDKKCNRLGFGKGYYDRFLPKLICKNIVGFAYDFQIVEELFVEEFDIPMDVVITEKNIYRRN